MSGNNTGQYFDPWDGVPTRQCGKCKKVAPVMGMRFDPKQYCRSCYDKRLKTQNKDTMKRLTETFAKSDYECGAEPSIESYEGRIAELRQRAETAERERDEWRESSHIHLNEINLLVSKLTQAQASEAERDALAEQVERLRAAWRIATSHTYPLDQNKWPQTPVVMPRKTYERLKAAIEQLLSDCA